jgi:hypothetical protein
VLYFFEKQILLGILGDRPWCPLSSVKILERSLVGAQYTNDRHFDQKTRENDQDRFFCRYFRSFSESTKAFAWTHIFKTPLFEDIASKLLKNWKKSILANIENWARVSIFSVGRSDPIELKILPGTYLTTTNNI